MATEPDPYRTLGLPRTASLAEVKAAYRRLAKANHPDTAGEAAVPRFLAIQAAYERLAGPMPGRPRPTTSPTPAPPPRQPWEADPDRSDATRRAYGGRARRPAGSTSRKTGGRPTSSGASGAAGGSNPNPGAANGPGTAGDTGTAGPAGGAKDPKKATLGSTSYDEADREAFEPDWVGASWYGTTSGTYWTINPKEYADPRKHGPEYQARARRASQAGKEPDAGIGEGADASRSAATGAPDVGTGAAPAAGEPVVNGPGPADPGPGSGAAAGPDPTPRHTTSSWWDATSGPASPEREPGASAPPRSSPQPRPRPAAAWPASRATSTVEPPPIDSLSGVGRALTQGTPPSFGWRIARAFVGWLPIALAIGWVTGEVSGCARYAVTCGDTTEPATWLAQGLVFVVLLAVPIVAGWAVIAALVSLIVAVPATLFVTASAGAEASSVGAGFLGVVLALAWLLGIVGAIVLGRRRSFDPTGPVS